MNAYDLEMLPQSAARGTDGNHGWVFGLPPGITPAQWPLDPNTGYPLMHGFTLLLPRDYRVHGPEIVAFSFFATAADQNDGGATEVPGVRDALTGPGPRPDDPMLAPFWDSARSAHPRLSRMTDILDMEYAVILLTQQEFDGPLCSPPAVLPLAAERSDAPTWLASGSAYGFHIVHMSEAHREIVEKNLRQNFGELPAPSPAYHRALRWTPRTNDPNAGMPPEDPFIGQQTRYHQPFFFTPNGKGENVYHEHAWTADHKLNHIGGTMRPVQNTPAFSPYYVEFEENFGGYNFGGGNAQLDFRDMKFDWACG